MRPKPSRDWVMVELERLGVRVVSGRLGRKAGEDDDGAPGENAPSGTYYCGVNFESDKSDSCSLSCILKRLLVSQLGGRTVWVGRTI